MLQRGLSRITESESFPSVGNVTSIEAGRPIAGIMNNSKLRLEVTSNLTGVDATLANWQFLGFAFNKYGNPANTKFKNVITKASSEDSYAVIDVPAAFFDSTTTSKFIYANMPKGKVILDTSVTSKSDINGDNDYFPDPTAGKIYVLAAYAGYEFDVQFTVVLDAYAAALDNQFGSNIYLDNVGEVNVITEAQTVAINSGFVNAAGYISSGVYGKAPKCYLNTDDKGNFVISIGESTGTELKNLLFLGFNGDSAVFKLVPNSNLS